MNRINEKMKEINENKFVVDPEKLEELFRN